jgi:hypothetical protein
MKIPYLLLILCVFSFGLAGYLALTARRNEREAWSEGLPLRGKWLRYFFAALFAFLGVVLLLVWRSVAALPEW